MNRGHDYNAQKDMQPLYALGGGPSLTALLAEELGVDVGDILATRPGALPPAGAGAHRAGG